MSEEMKEQEELEQGTTLEQPSNNEGTSQEEEEEEETQEPTTEELLEKANLRIAELEDQLLRKIAEFDNYRKRTISEKTELILNGGEKTIVSILPVLDDMERALKNMQQAEDVSAVLEGVELIYKKFNGILEKQGVSKIISENADFNVDEHEAIAQIPAPSEELKGKIIDCTQTGYKLNEKVIRYAQVVVGL